MEFHKSLDRIWLRVKTELQLAAFCRRLGLSAHLLRGRFERPQTPDFFHYSLRVELILQALQGPINRLSLTDDHFRHKTFFPLQLFLVARAK